MTTTHRAVPGSAWHFLVLLLSAVLISGPGCSRAEDTARQAHEAEAKAIAAIADGIQPLVARCEQLGMAREPPQAAKILVIDLKDGKRHPATDALPEDQRGRSADADLLVFAVVRVREERLKGFYTDGTDGIQVTAKVAAVRWPKKEPLGLYAVKATPPGHVPAFMRKEETPRANLAGALADAIKNNYWPKALSDRPEEFLLGGWQTNPAAGHQVSMIFQADGTFFFPDSARRALGLPGTDALANHHYKFLDKSTVELQFGSPMHRYLGKTARLSDLTPSGFILAWEDGTRPGYRFERGK